MITRPKGRNGQQHNNSRGLKNPLTSMDKSPRQTVNKETADLNETFDKMDLTDLYRTVHPCSKINILL